MAVNKADIVQTRKFIMAFDRKNRIECCLQALVRPLRWLYSSLQEFAIRLQLSRQQIWNRQSGYPFGKTFSDTFFFSKRITH